MFFSRNDDDDDDVDDADDEHNVLYYTNPICIPPIIGIEYRLILATAHRRKA